MNNENEVVNLRVRASDGTARHVQIRRSEMVRRAMASQVAQMTVKLARDVHITEAGRRIRMDPQWEQIYADPSVDMRIIAAAQRGKTLYQLVKTMAQLYLGLSVGWVLPKDNKIKELVNGKLNGTVKNTPEYLELQRQSIGADTVHYKTFGRFGKLYLVTANSENELTSFSADAMHIDERDFCNRVNLPMYPARMNASPYRMTDEISTPTIEGTDLRVGELGNDNIHSEWLMGDRHRYYSICPHCGHQQILDWYKNVINAEYDESGRITKFNVRDQDWSPSSPGDLRVCCARCCRPFDRTSRGVWIASRPGRKTRSYWVEPLAMSIGPNLDEMITSFTKAMGNPWKMQQFMNMSLGRPFAGGTLRFTRELFERCAGDHDMLSECPGPCTIGIDVNRPWLDVQISRWMAGKQVKVWVGKLHGTEDEVVRLCKVFNVVGGVIDNQPETKFAMQLQDRLAAEKIRLVRCRYASAEQSKMIAISEAGEFKSDAPRLITVHKTLAVDTLYAMMSDREVSWFRHWAGALDGAMFQEFTAPVRTLVTNNAGAQQFRWEGKPDHQLHAAVYDMLAGTVLGMDVVRDYSDIMPLRTQKMHSGGSEFKPSGGRQTRDDSLMIGRG